MAEDNGIITGLNADVKRIADLIDKTLMGADNYPELFHLGLSLRTSKKWPIH